jgi:hypothetical protein
MWHKAASKEDKEAIMRKCVFHEIGADDDPFLTAEGEKFRLDFFRGATLRDDASLAQLAKDQLKILLEWNAAPLDTDSPYVTGAIPNEQSPGPCPHEQDPAAMRQTIEDLLLFVPSHVRAAYMAGELEKQAAAKRRRFD